MLLPLSACALPGAPWTVTAVAMSCLAISASSRAATV